MSGKFPQRRYNVKKGELGSWKEEVRYPVVGWGLDEEGLERIVQLAAGRPYRKGTRNTAT